MIVVGVTGGIGAGKTAALESFHSFGANIFDADAVVHELYSSRGSLFDALVERWGKRVIAGDGFLDRRAVADIVFGSDSELAWLNSVVHPQVRRVMFERASRCSGATFFGIPLLHEVGWASELACVIAVWCDPETQFRRLRARGWTEAECRQRVSRQFSMDEKLLRSDFGIINTGSRALLARQCHMIYEKILERYNDSEMEG